MTQEDISALWCWSFLFVVVVVPMWSLRMGTCVRNWRRWRLRAPVGIVLSHAIAGQVCNEGVMSHNSFSMLASGRGLFLFKFKSCEAAAGSL